MLSSLHVFRSVCKEKKEAEKKKETVCFTVNFAFQSLRNSKGVFFYKIKDSWQPMKPSHIHKRGSPS